MQGQNASHPAIPPNLGNTINGHQAPPSVESWNSSVHGFPPNNVNPPLPQETPSEEKPNLKREREDEPNNTITNENPPVRQSLEEILTILINFIRSFAFYMRPQYLRNAHNL